MGRGEGRGFTHEYLDRAFVVVNAANEAHAGAAAESTDAPRSAPRIAENGAAERAAAGLPTSQGPVHAPEGG